MFQASFLEICYTVTFADSGLGVIILESKVTASWMCNRNRRCHGNVCINGSVYYLNYLNPTSSGVVIRLQHYVNECIFNVQHPWITADEQTEIRVKFKK